MKSEMLNSAVTNNIKRIYCNLFWNSSLIALDGSSLVIIELKRPQNWIALGFRFKYLPENQEYIEKENEFDKVLEDPATSKLNLTASTFLEITPDRLFFKKNVSENHKYFLSPTLNLEDDRIEPKIENIESYSMKEEEAITKPTNSEKKDIGYQSEMVVEKEMPIRAENNANEERKDEEKKFEEDIQKLPQKSSPSAQPKIDNTTHKADQQMVVESNGQQMHIENQENAENKLGSE